MALKGSNRREVIVILLMTLFFMIIVKYYSCDRECLKHIVRLQHSISWIQRGQRGRSGQDAIRSQSVKKASRGLFFFFFKF